MRSFPFLIISFLYFLCFPAEVRADKICGRVITPSGLNVREKPSLDSKVLHTLAQGDTFAYFSDGETGIVQNIQDGSKTVRGEWVEIILYPKFDDTYEEEAIGYIFYAAPYVSYLNCESFRHRLYRKDLYDGSAEYLNAKVKLREKLQIDFVDSTIFAQNFTRRNNQFLKQAPYYKLRGDTIFLRSNAANWYPIVSYPFGKDGNEDFTEVYEYLGYHRALGRHLVAGSYWESGNYYLVDAKTGKMEQPFMGLPSVSPNLKHMLSFTTDFEGASGTYLQVFTVENNEIKAIFAFQFKNWIYGDQSVWIDDQTIMIKVSSTRADQPIVAYAEEAKNIVPPSAGKRFQYLRISIR
ncbi:MAG: SH3 domain-containing protein [Saprospiraceae bacterium]